MAHKAMPVSKQKRAIAYSELQKAINSGKVKQRPCEVCGSINSVAHHEDYSKPLDVWWLCRKHHKMRHYELSGSAKLYSAKTRLTTLSVDVNLRSSIRLIAAKLDLHMNTVTDHLLRFAISHLAKVASLKHKRNPDNGK